MLFTIISLPCGAAFGQEADLSRFHRWAASDISALGSVIGKDPLKLAVPTLTLVIPLAIFDEQLSQRAANVGTNPFFDTVNNLGSPIMTPVTAGIFVASLFTSNPKMQDSAFTSFESLIYAGSITIILKNSLGRLRPRKDQGAFGFRGFSGHSSFPSGHTTAAFAILSPWVFYYPHPITYSLLAVASATGVARIYKEKHWPSDVAIGAAIGIGTARFLTKRHQNPTKTKRQRTRLSIAGLGARLTVGLD